MSECMFCDIIGGTAEATFVYRDERVSAFMDVQPVNPGHVLVVPNRHAAYLADLEEDTGMHIFRTAQRLAKALHQSGLRCEGVNMFLADGETAMQEVVHVHLHVFPRFEGDGFSLQFAEQYYKRPPRRELEEAAAALTRAL